MKRLIIIIAMLMLVSVSAYAEQKLLNITEDTLTDDSYKPVAGKEFLVAVKLQDEVQGQDPQPILGQTIQFQTSAGTLSDAEVITNIYGEAVTWLKTDTTPDTAHTITARIKSNNDMLPITISVKNIALPQDAPSAEDLQNQVNMEAKKIKDMIAEVDVTTNEPWSAPQVKLKVWEKGDLLKVQEISPNPNVFIRPLPAPTTTPPISIVKIIGYNYVNNSYILCSKDSAQESRYPCYIDYVDNNRKLIIKKLSYINESQSISKLESCFNLYTQIDNIWVVKEKSQIFYHGIGIIKYESKSVSSNILINSGVPDTEFK